MNSSIRHTHGNINSQTLGLCLLAVLLILLPSVIRADTSLQVGIAPSASANESNRTAYLTWTAAAGNNYLVQSSTNIGNPAAWTTEDQVSQGTVGPLKWMAPEALEVQKYYRLVLPQPRIFSVEPAVVTPGLPVDFYVLGQNFPTNALLQVNGVTQGGTVYSNSTTLVQPAFTPDVAGTYQVSLMISGVVVSTFNVVAADPLANPELVLQGPPAEPPAGPLVVKKGGHAQESLIILWENHQLSGRSVVGVGGGWNRVHNLASDLARGLDSSGHDEASTCGGGDGSGGVEGNLKAYGQWQPGASDPGGPMATLLMPALMKAKEKANQVKCGGVVVSFLEGDPDRPIIIGQSSVMPFSGEVQEGDADLAIPGRGLDFVWARKYHSRIGRFGSATNGWTFSYDVRCAQNASGGMDTYDGTGRKDTFTQGTNGVYTCPEFFREGTLSNNTFTLTFADTGRWVFSPFDGTSTAGKLIQIITRNGDTMTLGYDTSGRLAQVVDDLGRTNTVSYNTAGQLSAVTDFSGRSVTYQYYSGAKADNGSAGDLASVTSPPVTGTPNGNDFPSGKTTTYTYSKSFPLDRDNHLLLTVTDPKGQTAAVFSYEHSSTSANYLRCIAAQEGTNTPTVFSYSSLEIHKPQFAGTQACIVNDPVGNVTQYYFDARNRCLIEDDYTGRATPGLPVTATVNRPTGQLRSTDPAYYETTWSWSNDSLPTSVTSPGGQQLQYVYQSDFDPTTTARKRADCRVEREIAGSPVDLDGDGVADVTSRAYYYTYDPRFGSSGDRTANGTIGKGIITCPPSSVPSSSARSEGRAISTKGTCSIFRGWDGTVKGNAFSAEAASFKVRGQSGHDTLYAPVEGVEELFVPDGIIVTKPTGGTLGNSASLSRGIVTTKPGSPGGSSFAIKQKVVENPVGDMRDYEREPAHIEIPNPIGGQFVTSATDPRGNVTTGTYDAQGNILLRLRKRPELLYQAWQESFAYDTHSQLIAITNAADANGHSRVDTFGWSQGQITNSVVDAGGLALTESYEYDARGNLTRYIDPRTNDWLFVYNSLDQLVQASSAPGHNGSLSTFRTASQIAYDANDNLVQTATELRDPTGTLQGSQVDNYQYDGEDRLSQVALAIDASHALTNRYAYDGNDECVQVLGPDAVSGADSNQTEVFQYDERGLLFQSCAAPGTVLALTNQYSYDANARSSGHAVEKLTVAYETWTYDGFGRLASATDEMGNVTTFNYDANDNLKVARQFGELNDVPGSAGNVRLAESRYEYDGLDRLFRTHDLFFNPATQAPIGSGDAVASCVLAPDGECVSVTDSLGRTSSFAYDTACRLSSATDARGNITVTVLDAMGNPTAITRTELPDGGGSPQVFFTSYAYDSLNRCVNVSDNVGNTDAFAYDSLDRVVRETNPNGNDTTYTYDLLGDCLASADYAGSSASTKPVVLRSRSATYDTSARCLTSTDPKGNTTSYAYDSLGDCITVTEADGTQQSLVWSPRSNQLQLTDANSTTVTNSYDLSDRLVHRDLAARGVAVATTTFETFAYDGCDRLVLASNDVSQLTFSYDSFGDCTGSSQDGLAQSATYDSEGNPLSLTYPGDRVVNYAYDALDQVTNISTSANGVSQPQLARFAYAGPGRLAGIARDNGINTRVTWNGLVNPANSTGDYGWQEVSRVHDGTVASPSLVSDVTGTYSPAQSKLTRADAGRSSLTLTYDALEQLVEATDSVQPRDTIYALDAAGNRSHVITNSILMTPDYVLSSALPPGDFQMNRYTTTPFGGQSYDANGNLIERASAAGPTFYKYDYADRLVEVDALGTLGTLGPVATFTYDALGNRISKTTYPAAPAAPATTQYVLNGCGLHNGLVLHLPIPSSARILEERVGTSVNRAYCDMTTDGGGWTAQPRRAYLNFTCSFSNGHTYFNHQDDLGNTLALSDDSGTVVERYAYDDYGQPQFLDANGSPLVDSTGQPVTVSPAGNPFLFHSLEWDGESGLLGDGGGDYFDPLTACAIRGKVKNIKIDSTDSIGNNPWSGGGCTTATKNPSTLNRGYYKFYRMVDNTR
jgi:YD repeat-containing protein